MCIICIELIKTRMTLKEAERAVMELILTSKDQDRETKEHWIKLRSALKNDDLDSLDRTLEEGRT